MATKSTKGDWSISPADFGKSLKGFGINLLITDMKATADFSKQVLGADIVYWNEDFAVLKLGDVQWMLHTDHTYSDNPLLGFVQNAEGRGQGVELQLYNQDPDAAEARARARDNVVLAGCLNKPHGLRECYILDPDGYCWVLSRGLKDGEK